MPELSTMRICYMFDSTVSPQNFLRAMCIPTVGPSTTTVNSNATFPVYPYLFPLTEMTMIASNYSFVTSLSASCEVMTLRTAWVLVAHTCNPSYLGGRDQEDHGFKPLLSK
jgi:hypothetical protein